jgi:hypothetical protein
LEKNYYNSENANEGYMIKEENVEEFLEDKKG